MKTWEIHWAMRPTNYNTARVAIVEAETAEDAKLLLNDSLKKQGISEWSPIATIIEYKQPAIKGEVISTG